MKRRRASAVRPEVGRADRVLVAKGFAASRAEAQAAIAAGRVMADGRPVLKPSQNIGEEARIAYERAHPYVSRAALKLEAALDRFMFAPEGRTCLDLGASTGGFTQLLLQRGARRVFAVDAGHGQLHAILANDPRVVSIEGANARTLTQDVISEMPDAVTADLSFISLKLALPPALAMAAPGAWLVALVKPQFEAGRAHIGKGGIVKDEKVRRTVVADVVDWLAHVAGWRVLGSIESPIAGGDGNREFLIAAEKP